MSKKKENSKSRPAPTGNTGTRGNPEGTTKKK